MVPVSKRPSGISLSRSLSPSLSPLFPLCGAPCQESPRCRESSLIGDVALPQMPALPRVRWQSFSRRQTTRNIMNRAKAVNSATRGAPICLRITNSKSTMANHCQRERFRRSRRSVSTNSRWGARHHVKWRWGRFGVGAKASDCENPESKISTSSALNVQTPPRGTRTLSDWRMPIRNSRNYFESCLSRLQTAAG